MGEEEIILIPKLRAAALCASALEELTAKAAKCAHLKGSRSPPGEQTLWQSQSELTITNVLFRSRARRPTDNNECSV